MNEAPVRRTPPGLRRRRRHRRIGFHRGFPNQRFQHRHRRLTAPSASGGGRVCRSTAALRAWLKIFCNEDDDGDSATLTSRARPVADLNLGVIGNCSINALIDRRGCVVWSCMPRPDSEPVFNALLSGADTSGDHVTGLYDVLVENFATSRRSIMKTNTAVLVTRLGGRRRTSGGDHRLRAALQPHWPPVPAHARSSAASAPWQAGRASRSACARHSTTALNGRKLPAGSNHVRYVGARASPSA